MNTRRVLLGGLALGLTACSDHVPTAVTHPFSPPAALPVETVAFRTVLADAGIDAYVQARYQDAIPHFRMAYASDPAFYAALLMAGVCAGNAGERARADSFYALVVPHKDRLSAYYQSRLEAQMASSAGDLAAYIAGNRRAAAGPGTKAAYNVAQGVIQQGRANEARAMLRQLDPDREPMRGYASYFGVYRYAAHQLGDYEDELQMARRARGPLSGDVRAVALEVEALVPLGRTAERWLSAAIKWFDTLPPAEAKTADNRADKAYALYAAARYQEAAAIYDGLASDLPGQPQWQAWQGLLGALLGDKAKAMDVSHRIETNAVRVGANSAV